MWTPAGQNLAAHGVDAELRNSSGTGCLLLPAVPPEPLSCASLAQGVVPPLMAQMSEEGGLAFQRAPGSQCPPVLESCLVCAELGRSSAIPAPLLRMPLCSLMEDNLEARHGGWQPEVLGSFNLSCPMTLISRCLEPPECHVCCRSITRVEFLKNAVCDSCIHRMFSPSRKLGQFYARR